MIGGQEYTPPAAIAARRRADGRKLTLAGAVLGGVGAAGLVLVTLLDLVWLRPIANALEPLAGIALVLGVIAFFVGFSMIRGAR